MAIAAAVSQYLGGVLHGKQVSLEDRQKLIDAASKPSVKNIGDFPPDIQSLIYAIETDTNDQSSFAKAPARRK